MKPAKIILFLVGCLLIGIKLNGQTQTTFTKKGNKIQIPYMAGFEVEVNGNKVKQEILAGKDFSQLKPEVKGTSNSLSVPANFDLNKAFFDALKLRTSKNTTSLPLDLTPILDTFLLKYDPTVNGFPKNSRLILTSLEFQPNMEKAFGHLILAVEKIQGNWMILANSKVEFAPNAVGFKNLRLFLTKAEKSGFKPFPFEYIKSIEQDSSSGSFAYITCDGFQKYNLQAKYTFSPKMMAPKWTSKEIFTSGLDTLKRSLEAKFIISGKEIRLFQDAKVTELKEGMVFNVENFVFDFKEAYIHTKAKQVKSSTQDKATPLIGIEIKKVGASLPGFRTGQGTARKMMRIPGKDFRWTHAGGMEGTTKIVNFLPMGKENLSGWKYSIDTLEYKFINNNDNTPLTMTGDIMLPICKDSTFRYRGEVSMGVGTAKNNFVPQAQFEATRGSQGKTFPLDFWRINMRLATSNTAANSTVGLAWFGDGKDWYAGEFEPNADLNGIFEIDWTKDGWRDAAWKKAKLDLKYAVPVLAFEGFKINDNSKGTTNDCAAGDTGGIRNMGIEGFALGSSYNTPGAANAKTMSLNELPVSIRDINFRCLKDGSDVLYKMDFEVHVNLLGTDEDDPKNTKQRDKNKLLKLKFKNDKNLTSSKKKQEFNGRARSKKMSATEWKDFTSGKKGTSGKSGVADLTAIGQFALWGKLDPATKEIKYDDSRFPIDLLYVEGQISCVYLAGGFSVFNELENEIHGDGFKGFLNIEVELGKKGSKIGGAVVGQFGASRNKVIVDKGNGNVQTQKGTEQYRYGFMDGEVVYSKGIHIAKGLFFNGGGFSFAVNMRRSALSDDIALEQTQPDKQRNEAVKTTDPPDIVSDVSILTPGKSLTGATYLPSQGLHSGSIKGVFSWGKAVDTDERPPKLSPIYAFDAEFGVELEETRGNGSGVGLSKIWFNANAYAMPEGITYKERRDCAYAMELALEYDHLKKQISGKVPVPGFEGSAELLFEIPNPDKIAKGEMPKWFVKAGRAPGKGDPLKKRGLPDFIKKLPIPGNQDFELYFQAGVDLDPMPELKDVIPNWTNDAVMTPRVVSSDQMKNGNGVALGAKLSIPEDPYDYLMFTASFYAGIGFDLSLQQYSPGVVAKLSCGDGKTFGINNWYARGQAYAYMAGKLDMHVDLAFFEGNVNLFDFYIAAAMRGELPNPEWFMARIKGRYSILGGRLEGSVDMKTEIGERCGNLQGNPVAGINVIQEVLPEDNAKDVPIFQNPVIVFTMPIGKPLALSTDNPDGTSQINEYKPVVEGFKLDGRLISAKAVVSPDFRSVTMEMTELLHPNTTYTYEAIVKWQKKGGQRSAPHGHALFGRIPKQQPSGWNDLIYQGSVARETRKGSFKTASRPTKIMAEALEYQAPGYDQRYWHKGYAKGQLLFKQSGWGYLFPKDTDELKLELKKSNTNSATEKERKKDLANIDKLPAGVPFEYKIKITKVGSKNTKEYELDEFPGKVSKVQQPSVGSQTGKNLQYDLPVVVTSSVSGKAVIFDKINQLNLDKGKVYKLEIIREPIASYQNIATKAVMKTALKTDAIFRDTAGKAVPYDGVFKQKLTKVDKSKTGGADLMYKILYEYHFGISQYNNLADKLNVLSIKSSTQGETKDKWDHPSEALMPLWKINNKNVVANRGDNYHRVNASSSKEPLDKYDEIKLLKNLIITYPYVKTEWEYDGQYGLHRGKGAQGKNKDYQTATTHKLPVVEGQHPWEKEIYLKKDARYRTKKTDVDYARASTTDYYSIPRIVHHCGHTQKKEATLATITSGGMDGTKFRRFAEYIWRPYFEERVAQSHYEKNMDHWAFRLRFNQSLKNKLSNEEKAKGIVANYTVNGKIDGLPNKQTSLFAFEDGRERILLSQFQMLKKIGALAHNGDWVNSTWVVCSKDHNAYRWKPTLNYFRDYPINALQNIKVSGQVKWEFPNVPNWQRFDQKVKPSVFKGSPKTTFTLNLRKGGSSNTNNNFQAEIKLQNDFNGSSFLKIIHEPALTKIESFVAYNKDVKQIEYYYDSEVGESHKWANTDRYAPGNGNTYNKLSLGYGATNVVSNFGWLPVRNSNYTLQFKINGKYYSVDINTGQEKTFTVTNNSGSSSKPSLWKSNLHLRLDHDLKTKKLAVQMSGLQSTMPKVMSLYNEVEEREFIIYDNKITTYENGLPKNTQSINYRNINQTIKLAYKKKYQLYVEDHAGKRMQYELNQGFWKFGKSRIPLLFRRPNSKFDGVTLNQEQKKFDDCYLAKPVSFNEGQQLALNFKDNNNFLTVSGNEKAGIIPIKLDTNSFTIDIWLKRENSNRGVNIIRQGGSGNYQQLRIDFQADNKMKFGFGGDDLITGQGYTDKDWHHWIFTFDQKTKVRRIFRDGQLVIEDIAKGDLKSKGDFHIGMGFDGQIGSLSVWRKALDYQELPTLSKKIGNEGGLGLFLDFTYSKQKTGLFVNKGPLNSKIKFNGYIDCALNGANYKNNIQALAQNTTFSAKDGYVQFEGNTPRNNSMTIEFLAKGDSIKGKQVIISKQGGWEIALNAENTFSITNQKSKFSTPKGTFAADGKWHHYAFVFKDGNQRKVFIDGKIVKVDRQAFTIKRSPEPVFLGKPANGQAKFNGLIDELRIWNEAITDKSVSDYSFREVSTDCPDLVHVYNNFEQASLSSKIGQGGKYTGQGNWGKKEFLTMKPSTYTPCSKVFTCETGICNLKLNGGGTYVKSTKPIQLKKSFTIEFKAKRNNIGSKEYLLSHKENTKGFEIGYTEDDKFFLFYGGNEYLSDATYKDKNFRHWTIVSDDAAQKIEFYLNGTLAKSHKRQGNYEANGYLQLGADISQKAFFGGQLDDIRIWKVARKAKDIKLAANKFIQANCPDLLVYYDFNNGKIKDLVDKTGKNKAEFVNFQGGAGFNTSKVMQEEGITSCTDNREWAYRSYSYDDKIKFNVPEIASSRGRFRYEGSILRLEFDYNPAIGGAEILKSYKSSRDHIWIKGEKEFSTYRPNRLEIKHNGEKYYFPIQTGWHKYIVNIYRNSNGAYIKINGVDRFKLKKDFNQIAKEVTLASRVKGNVKYVKLFAWDKLVAAMSLNEGLGSSIIKDGKQNKSYKVHPKNSWAVTKDNTTKGPKTKGNFAIDFDGVDDELTGAGNVDLANKSFTIEFWAKRKALNGTDFIVSQGKQERYKGLHIGFRHDNTFTVDFYGDGINSPAYNDLDWHHWAIAYDKLGKRQTIYRDGIKVADKIVAQDYQGTGELLLAKDIFNGKFKGQLGEIRIWDTYRQSELIVENANKVLTGKEPNLLRLYQFGLDNLNGATERTGKGSNLTIKNKSLNKDVVKINEAKIALPSPPATAKIPPNSNIGLDFDGIDDHLNLGKVDLANKSFSIEFWAKQNQNNRNSSVIGQGINSTRKGLSVGFTKDNKFQFGFFGDDLISPAYSDKDWHHWAVTFDASNKKKVIYRDGKKVAENTASGSYEGTGDLFVGLAASLNEEKYFNGVLDELRIWNKTRSASDIAADWKSTITNKAVNLVFNIKFNDGPGSKGTTNQMLAKGEIPLVNMNEKTDWGIVPFQLKPKKDLNEINHILNFDKTTLTFPKEIVLEFTFTIEFLAKEPLGNLLRGRNIEVSFSLNNELYIGYRGGHGQKNVIATQSYSNSAWHHWAIVRNGDKLLIYRDGVKIKEKSGTNPWGNIIELTPDFEGQLDELRFWKIARSEKDIKANMKKILTGKESGLISYLKFSEGKGSSTTLDLVSKNKAKLVGINKRSWIKVSKKEQNKTIGTATSPIK